VRHGHLGLISHESVRTFAQVTDVDRNTEGAAALQRALDATGFNAHQIAERSRGGVSDATIRNYLAGKPYTRTRLRAIAEVLPVPWGERVLLEYGEIQMAEDLAASPGGTLRRQPEFPQGGVVGTATETMPQLTSRQLRIMEVLLKHLGPAMEELEKIFADSN